MWVLESGKTYQTRRSRRPRRPHEVRQLGTDSSVPVRLAEAAMVQATAGSIRHGPSPVVQLEAMMADVHERQARSVAAGAGRIRAAARSLHARVLGLPAPSCLALRDSLYAFAVRSRCSLFAVRYSQFARALLDFDLVHDADDGGVDGRALRPSASPAARPSSTASTISPRPAPTESIARIDVPRDSPSGVIGCTISSLAPSNCGRFLVDDDFADHAREDQPGPPPSSGPRCRRCRRHRWPAGWKGKLASLPRTKNTCSPTPAPTASTATSGRPAGSSFGGQGLHEQQRDAVERIRLPCRDDVADDAGELHGTTRPGPTVSTMPTRRRPLGHPSDPIAMRAELPLTMSTVSPTPASTVSTATR